MTESHSDVYRLLTEADKHSLKVSQATTVRSKYAMMVAGHRLDRPGKRAIRSATHVKRALSKVAFIRKTRTKGYEGAPTYLKKVWKEYQKDGDFIAAYNRWLRENKNDNAALMEIFKFAHKTNYKDNLVFLTTADKRQGKSTKVRKCARLDAELLRSNIHWHMNPANQDEITDEVLDGSYTRWIHVYIVIGFQKAPEVLPRMHAHDWLIVDELPEMQMEGSLRLAKSVRNLIKIASGKRQLNIAIINQYLTFVEGVQFVLRVIATDRVHYRTVSQLMIQTTDGKDGKVKVFTDGIVDLDVSEEKYLHEVYERHNDEMKERSQNHGGTQIIDIDLKDVTRVVQATRHMTPTEIEAIGKTFSNKDALSAFVDVREDLSDIADHPRKQSIVVLALNNIKERARRKKNGELIDDDERDACDDPMPQVASGGQAVPLELSQPAKIPNPAPLMPKFVFDDSRVIRDMLAQNQKRWGLKVEAWTRYKDGQGETQDVICLDFIKRGIVCKARTIGNWIQSVKGELNNRRGEAYEPHYVEYAKASGLYSSVKAAGGTGGQGHGNADVIRVRVDGVHEVVQLKCYNTSEARSGCTIPIDKFAPEIKRVRILKKQGIPAICIGHVYFYELGYYREQFIDIDHLPASVSFPL